MDLVQVQKETLTKRNDERYPIYSNDWFTHNIPNWTRWLSCLRDKGGLLFLELGCYEGMATRWLLDNILTNPSSSIHVVDTFSGSHEHSRLDTSNMYVNFMNNAGFEDRVKVFQQKTKKYLTCTEESFDFIYVDASHKTKNVLVDGIMGWDKLKKNGIMIFDDYCWKKYPESSDLHPKRGIDHFLERFDSELELIAKGYQVCVKKVK